jgi:hypothetical protein
MKIVFEQSGTTMHTRNSGDKQVTGKVLLQLSHTVTAGTVVF